MNQERPARLAVWARRVLFGAWYSGVLPLSHTWLLADRAFEEPWFPAYLLTVFVVGTAAIGISSSSERGVATARAWGTHALGWATSAALGLGLEATLGWLPVVAFAAWFVLGAVSLAPVVAGGRART